LVEVNEVVRWVITPGAYTISPVAASADIEILSDDVGELTLTVLDDEGSEEGSDIARFRITSSNPNETGTTVNVSYI
jgi:hypothetical protein